MTFVIVLGDPDKLASFLNSVISSGNDIEILKKTQNHSTYIVGFASSGGGNSYILMESGDYLLLESGDRIIL
jgi:hypothetical protein